MPQFLVIAFYHFVGLPDFQEKRQPLQKLCAEQKIKGSILLAAEGINGTIAGLPPDVMKVMNFLKSDPRLGSLSWKESYSEELPFHRMKVRLKKEIVTLGVADADPNTKVGTYVKPEEWNKLLQDPEVVLIDTRNAYEVELGTFKGAVNPNTKSFRQFPDYARDHLDASRDQKVALFCTGGIRCEKASSYLLKQGFKEVYHLEGGILKYLEKVPPAESLWQGECFVFDNRVTVADGLRQGTYKLCYGCKFPVSQKDAASPLYEEGISCPRCHGNLTPQKRSRLQERQRQCELARGRNQKHVGPPNGGNAKDE